MANQPGKTNLSELKTGEKSMYQKHQTIRHHILSAYQHRQQQKDWGWISDKPLIRSFLCLISCSHTLPFPACVRGNDKRGHNKQNSSITNKTMTPLCVFLLCRHGIYDIGMQFRYVCLLEVDRFFELCFEWPLMHVFPYYFFLSQHLVLLLPQ